MKRYSLETLLAFQFIKEKILESIEGVEITEEGEIKFTVDIKSNRGKYKKNVTSVLWTDLVNQYETLVSSEMIAEGYLFTPVKGGWLVISPTGEEYQLTETECTCNDNIYKQKESICKHMMLRNFFLNYRNRVNQYKIKNNIE